MRLYNIGVSRVPTVFNGLLKLFPGVAQLVAHLTGGQGVVSSSLATRTMRNP